jgi:hypothetical protein
MTVRTDGILAVVTAVVTAVIITVGRRVKVKLTIEG